MGLTDTLAFSVSKLITAVKSFMIQAPGIVKLNIVTPLLKNINCQHPFVSAVSMLVNARFRTIGFK